MRGKPKITEARQQLMKNNFISWKSYHEQNNTCFTSTKTKIVGNI